MRRPIGHRPIATDASERGGGICAWLEGIKVTAALRGKAVFVASGGHELDHLGLKQWLSKQDNAEALRTAEFCLHLGANSASRNVGLFAGLDLPATIPVNMQAPDERTKDLILGMFLPYCKLEQGPPKSIPVTGGLD